MGFSMNHFQYLKRAFLLGFGRINAQGQDDDCTCHASFHHFCLLPSEGADMSQFVYVMVFHSRVLMKTGSLSLILVYINKVKWGLRLMIFFFFFFFGVKTHDLLLLLLLLLHHHHHLHLHLLLLPSSSSSSFSSSSSTLFLYGLEFFFLAKPLLYYSVFI